MIDVPEEKTNCNREIKLLKLKANYNRCNAFGYGTDIVIAR